MKSSRQVSVHPTIDSLTTTTASSSSSSKEQHHHHHQQQQQRFKDDSKEQIRDSSISTTLTTTSSSAAAGAGGGKQSNKVAAVTCDKCDGAHETSDCPYYRKEREKHPDAQKNFYKKLGGTSSLPGAVIRSGRVVRQPGDGSCLFHSLSYGLRDGSNASSLRRDICSFINKYPQTRIADTPLSDWIKWDSGGNVGGYTRRMSAGAWGGGIEMASVSIMKEVNVHVYERSGSGFTRISAFDHPQSPETRRTIRVLYCGGVHYGESCSSLFVLISLIVSLSHSLFAL